MTERSALHLDYNRYTTTIVAYTTACLSGACASGQLAHCPEIGAKSSPTTQPSRTVEHRLLRYSTGQRAPVRDLAEDALAELALETVDRENAEVGLGEADEVGLALADVEEVGDDVVALHARDDNVMDAEGREGDEYVRKEVGHMQEAGD